MSALATAFHEDLSGPQKRGLALASVGPLENRDVGMGWRPRSMGGPGVSTATVKSLARDGLLSLSGRRYALTDLGRSAVELLGLKP